VLIKLHGLDYPDAVTQFGVRMPLVNERRFTRAYENEEEKLSTEISRFSDGTAFISLSELTSDWADWPDRDKHDFCWGFSSLHEHPEFAAMLRFLMENGDRWQKSGVALLVAHALPVDEAYLLLEKNLELYPDYSANLIQAIALTKHPCAASLIRQHLAALWIRADLWEDNSFLNWTAADAISCIEYLVELGETPSDFETEVRALNDHLCAGNRDSCRRSLSKHFYWLPAPEPSRFEGMTP
jgi:hypothetical protein